MLRKVTFFAYILLLEHQQVTAMVLSDEDKALGSVIQSKNIHIVDVQGNLGELEINATYKDIQLMNIAGKSGENLFANMIGQSMMQPQEAKSGDHTAIIRELAELKAQLANLNETMMNLKTELASRADENKTKSSCSEFDIVGSVQLISVPGGAPFGVLCDECGSGTGWIVIQHRFDGGLSFYKDWSAYRNGFGFYNGEFFIGLEHLYRLTKSRPFELYIELVDFNNHLSFARYDSFLIGSEEERYMLKSLGTYSGNAGDSLKYNLYDKFSTYDNDNDRWPRGNCANFYESGWWFNWDTNSNLNGIYLKNGEKNPKGIWWYTLKGYYSLKSVKMLIRPKYTLI